MSIPNRTTIDQLDVGFSKRYAQDQEQLQTPIARDIRDSTGVSTQVGVFTPSNISELELLMGPSSLTRTVADFWAPGPSVVSQVFSFLLIPSLGSPEKQETLLQKINEQLQENANQRAEVLKKLVAKTDTDDQSKKRQIWQVEKEGKEEQLEQKHLLSFLNLVQYLNKCLTDANAHRNQYQRG